MQDEEMSLSQGPSFFYSGGEKTTASSSSTCVSSVHTPSAAASSQQSSAALKAAKSTHKSHCAKYQSPSLLVKTLRREAKRSSLAMSSKLSSYPGDLIYDKVTEEQILIDNIDKQINDLKELLSNHEKSDHENIVIFAREIIGKLKIKYNVPDICKTIIERINAEKNHIYKDETQKKYVVNEFMCQLDWEIVIGRNNYNSFTS